MNDSSFALESLLLFQSVAAHGATQQSFSRISEALKSSNLLRQSTTLTDDHRFDATALTNTYLALLKAEAKAVTQNAASEIASQPASPKLSTIEDAAPHLHLVPRMIPKLYDDYKERLIREVRVEEKRYDQLLEELNAIKDEARTTKDASSKREVQAIRPSSSDKTKLESILNQNHEPPTRSSQNLSEKVVSTSPVRPEVDHTSQPQRPLLANSPTKSIQGLPAPSLESPRLLPPPHGYSRQFQPTGNGQWPHQEATLSPDHNPPRPQYAQQSPRREQPRGSPPPHADTMRYQQWMHLPYSAPPLGPPPASPAHQHALQESHPQAAVRRSQEDHPPRRHIGQNHTVQVRPAHSEASWSDFGPPLQTRMSEEVRSETGSAQTSFRGPQATPRSAAQASPALANLLNQPPAATYSPGSTTGWRTDVPFLAEGDRPRSISPVSDHGETASLAPPPRPRRRGNLSGLQRASDQQAGTSRRTSKTPSVPATSTSQGRTRSQSIASFADDVSTASGPSAVKRSNTRISTPTPGDRPTLRHTRNMSSINSSTKRMRRDSTADSFVTAEAPPSPLRPRPIHQMPDTIVATRNFQRMTNPLLDNIVSHKFASTFAVPVKASTKGYYSTIYRPTDLKTIRGQIAQGNRAVIAATAALEAGSPGNEALETGTTVTLPYSEGLEPPKAIVNADQLEQELMRMFANAVMFNEGDGGVVLEAREMCEDVLRVLADFRGAEGGAITMDLDDGPSSTKRRRV